jgi:hypothetical protein
MPPPQKTCFLLETTCNTCFLLPQYRANNSFKTLIYISVVLKVCVYLWSLGTASRRIKHMEGGGEPVSSGIKNHTISRRLKHNVFLHRCWKVRSPTRMKKNETSPCFVRSVGHCCRGDLAGRTTFWIVFEWLAKVKSLVAVACLLPGRAKDLSALGILLLPSSSRFCHGFV